MMTSKFVTSLSILYVYIYIYICVCVYVYDAYHIWKGIGYIVYVHTHVRVSYNNIINDNRASYSDREISCT